MFNIEEFCDCLEYDLLYDREDLQYALQSNDKLLHLTRLHNLLNRRQFMMLKLIHDKYIENGIPDRLLDLYLDVFKLENTIEKLIHYYTVNPPHLPLETTI